MTKKTGAMSDDAVRVDLHLAAEVAGVKPGTIRQWVHRGLLTRHPDGYDLKELVAAVESRSPAALARRAGLAGDAFDAACSGDNRAVRLLAEAIVRNRVSVTHFVNTRCP